MVLAKSKIIWTHHAREKMRFYGLSESRVLKVLHKPQREEDGIAPGTIALMQTAGSKKHPYEVWVMLENLNEKKRLVSVWKYPARSVAGKPPLPHEDGGWLRLHSS